MQRYETESFADYKERRAAANRLVKSINADSKGGSENTRAKRLRPPSVGFKGMASSRRTAYGAGIAAKFARANATAARRSVHTDHLIRMYKRVEARALAKIAAL